MHDVQVGGAVFEQGGYVLLIVVKHDGKIITQAENGQFGAQGVGDPFLAFAGPVGLEKGDAAPRSALEHKDAALGAGFDRSALFKLFQSGVDDAAADAVPQHQLPRGVETAAGSEVQQFPVELFVKLFGTLLQQHKDAFSYMLS